MATVPQIHKALKATGMVKMTHHASHQVRGWSSTRGDYEVKRSQDIDAPKGRFWVTFRNEEKLERGIKALREAGLTVTEHSFLVGTFRVVE